MPNVTLHYTENIGTHLQVPLLLKDIHDALIGLASSRPMTLKPVRNWPRNTGWATGNRNMALCIWWWQ